MIYIFIVAEHPALRAGIHALLALEPDLLIVGETQNGLDVATQLLSNPPDIVVLESLELTLRLHQQHPALRLLVLSESEDLAAVAELRAAGALGCLLKSASLLELVHAVRMVASGRPFLCSCLGLAALREQPAPVSQVPAALAAPPAWVSHLSEREQQVLELLAHGLTTEQIAQKLFTSPRTVETHRRSIIDKAGVINTASLIRHAMQQGWLT